MISVAPQCAYLEGRTPHESCDFSNTVCLKSVLALLFFKLSERSRTNLNIWQLPEFVIQLTFIHVCLATCDDRVRERRVCHLDGVRDRVRAEYHGAQLMIDCKLIGGVGRLERGALYQFIGELYQEYGVRHANSPSGSL